jgi:hypothetical protein
MRDYAIPAGYRSAGVGSSALKSARVLDASDVRKWLIELAEMAEKAEQAKNLEQFLSRGGF